MFVSLGLVVGFTVALAGLALSGCGTRLNKAPVEDRGTSSSSAPSSSAQPGVVLGTPIKPLPGAENAGKPGYYTVKPGDTLIRIGLESGQSWKDIARWNNLDNANLIEVGQVLRVAPPVAASQAVASDSGVVTRPVTSSSTLTYTMIHALGTRYCGAFASTEQLGALAVTAGRTSGERICTFPMDADYDEDLDSKVA